MISPAFAQTSGAGGGGDLIGLLLPMVAIFGIFYLLVIRPQQKRMKEHQDVISAVRRGDMVVTSGGIIGKVTKVAADGELRVEIADGVQVRVVKGTISEVRGKGEPVRDRAKGAPAANDDEDAAKPSA